MNKHVASVIPFRRPLEALDRSEIVKSMAEHLAAAVIADHLDLASEIDVIDTLWRAPEQWQSRVILNHLDDALLEARQILIAGEMSRG